MKSNKNVVLLLISAMSIGCINNQSYEEENIKLDKLSALYEDRNFKEVDYFLDRNKFYVNKYNDFAEYLLHRRIMYIHENPNINFKYPDIVPQVILNAKEGAKTTYLSQSYQEYVLSLQNKPIFIDGICPSKPLEEACACRRLILLGAQAPNNYFVAQRSMWFSEYLSKMCPNDALIQTANVLMTAVISEDKATTLLNNEKQIRSKADYSSIEHNICLYKDIYSDHEAIIKFIEKSDLVNCD